MDQVLGIASCFALLIHSHAIVIIFLPIVLCRRYKQGNATTTSMPSIRYQAGKSPPNNAPTTSVDPRQQSPFADSTVTPNRNSPAVLMPNNENKIGTDAANVTMKLDQRNCAENKPDKQQTETRSPNLENLPVWLIGAYP
ncbi:unnamed protein product [Anisakis simplex]|uniref:Uncharacterized protein n=1 Tax=Anisakis simplex TaxID=6269 RepID=A0A0M3J1U5_ANISI|nr:unnamed protein product [Anisakis simplex]